MIRDVGLSNLHVHIYSDKDPQFIRYKKLWNRVKEQHKKKDYQIDYIMFTDDDDLWAPDRTEHFLANAYMLSKHSQLCYGIFSYYFIGKVACAKDAQTWQDVMKHNLKSKKREDNLPDNYINLVM
ncbi:MAG: hypothetical protein EOP45_11855 [Sphingobacteriaceae bacterium]|nr:MAG: hypothetical protein EOP45_11855 [Sphingobacteriaceae bacterium]